MKLPKLDDLIGEQLKVYEHRADEHLFVAGPPGSGKTSLAVLRAKFLTDFGQRVILVTRNRMLATLARQLGEAVFNTATMHSHIATDHSRRLGGLVPQLVPFVYDWDQIWRAYAENDLKPVVDHMVIDEGQNLPPPFFRWALEFGAKTLTVFADEDQATDENRSSLKDICDAGMPHPHRLTENHRNTEEIALVAEHFHRSHVLPPGVVSAAAGAGRHLDSWACVLGMKPSIALRHDTRTVADLLELSFSERVSQRAVSGPSHCPSTSRPCRTVHKRYAQGCRDQHTRP